MNYIQRIATAAVSGAVASSVAMVLNRRVGEPFREYLHRRKQLAELKVWYKNELTRAEDFATRLTTRFVATHPHEVRAVLEPQVELDRASVEQFAAKIYWYVWKYKEVSIVQERSVRLSGISPKRADDEDVHAVELLAGLVEEEDKMRQENYPMDAVLDMIKTFK